MGAEEEAGASPPPRSRNLRNVSLVSAAPEEPLLSFNAPPPPVYRTKPFQQESAALARFTALNKELWWDTGTTQEPPHGVSGAQPGQGGCLRGERDAEEGVKPPRRAWWDRKGGSLTSCSTSSSFGITQSSRNSALWGQSKSVSREPGRRPLQIQATHLCWMRAITSQ